MARPRATGLPSGPSLWAPVGDPPAGERRGAGRLGRTGVRDGRPCGGVGGQSLPAAGHEPGAGAGGDVQGHGKVGRLQGLLLLVVIVR